MTTQQKITSQILTREINEHNKLTDKEAEEYAKEMQREIYNFATLSTAEKVIYENLLKWDK